MLLGRFQLWYFAHPSCQPAVPTPTRWNLATAAAQEISTDGTAVAVSSEFGIWSENLAGKGEEKNITEGFSSVDNSFSLCFWPKPARVTLSLAPSGSPEVQRAGFAISDVSDQSADVGKMLCMLSYSFIILTFRFSIYIFHLSLVRLNIYHFQLNVTFKWNILYIFVF